MNACPEQGRYGGGPRRRRGLMCASLGFGFILCFISVSVHGDLYDTGFHNPSSVGPNDTWGTPENAYSGSDGDLFAWGTTQNDLQDYGTFGFDVPDGVTINGVEVRAEWSGNNVQPCTLGIELSWNSGTNYTLTGYTDSRTSKTDSDSIFGGASNLWGRTWSCDEFSDANFRVRFQAIDANPPIRLDWCRAKIYYVMFPPEISNDGGVSNVTSVSATLNGTVSAGLPTPDVFVYWGPGDGDTNKTAWSNSIPVGTQSGSFYTNITGLLANKTYWYRCYASNAADEVWADASTNFTTIPPAVSFTNTPYDIAEDGGTQTVSVVLSISSAVPVSINFATSYGTATNTDYTSTNGTLTWAAEETGVKTFEVLITDDGTDENDETINLTLSYPTNCTIGVGNASITIQDDDGFGTIRFNATNSSGSEAVTSTNILVTLLPVAAVQVKANYIVTGGTAVNGEDYTLAAGIVTVLVGQTSAKIYFTVTDDDEDEGNETIIVKLYNAINASLGLYTNHTYTIIDDDASSPTLDNGSGASEITSSSAKLRGSVTATGGENPDVYIYWGPANGGTNASAWTNSISMGTLGAVSFSSNISGLVSNQAYYYRCYATNSAGGAWAANSENFTALDPPSVSLLVNGGFEDGTGSDADHWGRSSPDDMARASERARTGSYSMRYEPVAGIYAYGYDNNYFYVSWNGLYAGGGTHPDGGVRPGFVLSGEVYVRAKTGNADMTQFTCRWRNVDDAVNWMSAGRSGNLSSYTKISMSRADPVLVADVGDRYRPELVRDTVGSIDWHADDLTMAVSLPIMELQRSPTQEYVFADTIVDEYSDTNFGVRCQGGGAGTVLYGVYITNIVDLTNAAWSKTAWYVTDDPSNAFSVASGAALTASNNAGYRYATIRFTPPSSGTFTGLVRVATTDPANRYSGGGTLFNTIVYEQYTVIGTGVIIPPTISNNGGASNVTETAATLNGIVVSTGGDAPDVYVYWGPADGGTNASGWTNSISMSTQGGFFSTNITNLVAGQMYYYRCYATNSAGQDWADSSSEFFSNTDQDSDGMPDAWETAYGLNPGSSSDATTDIDSDGVNNLNEYTANTIPTNSLSYMRIVDVDQSGTSDIKISFWAGQERTYTILAIDSITGSKTSAGTTVPEVSGTNYWTDSGALDETSQRFYNVKVTHSFRSYTNTTDWAMHSQTRQVSSWHLVCVPVHWGSTSYNTLDSTLGTQIGRGLTGGGSDSTSDNLWIQNNGNWERYWLDSSDVWRDTNDAPATLEIKPGTGFWIKRYSSGPSTSKTVFGGRMHSSSTPITFGSNTWTVFGWPYAKPGYDSEGPKQGWGFGFEGGSGSYTWRYGDNMIGEYNGSQYAIFLNTDWRWYKRGTRVLTSVPLEAGKAYYYYHRGTGMVWTAVKTQ